MRYDHLIGRGFDRWIQGEYTPGQIAALADFDSSFILLSGSYRSGKTEVLARAIHRHNLVFQYAKSGVFRAKLASLKKSTLITILELCHPSWVSDWSNTDLVLTYTNGSQLSFVGADFPDRLGSIELTMAAIDEAAEVSEESITMIQGRLSGPLEVPRNYDQLSPHLKAYVDTTLENRQTWLACNPKSKSHPLYPAFFGQPKPGHKAYISNSIANTNLPVSYLTQNLSAYVRDSQPLDWVKEQIDLIRTGQADSNGLHLQPHLTPLGQRNMLGLWVALEGAIFEMDDKKHLLDNVPADWVPTGRYILGGDFGFHNPRIGIVGEYRVGGQVAYAVEGYWAGTASTADDYVAAMKDRDWNIGYLPPDRPDIFKKARQTFGASRVRKAKTSVFPGINTVSTFLNKGHLIFLKRPGWELCWAEFTGYEWKKDGDKNSTDEPVKKDDHWPDAIRYVLHTIHWKGSPTSLPTPSTPDVSTIMRNYR